MYQDETLVCRDCGEEFVFTVQEQQFYAEKGFENKPSRCRSCRMARKVERNDRGEGSGAGRYGRSDRVMYEAVCAECGAPAQVPFKPRDDRPVYCRDCFSKRNR
ncbi:MAG: zinc-ribbon domain containing protein [Christensenellales bacterium]|jgi:CxxC-x17-CxxC domain-containing protein